MNILKITILSILLVGCAYHKPVVWKRSSVPKEPVSDVEYARQRQHLIDYLNEPTIEEKNSILYELQKIRGTLIDGQIMINRRYK